VAVLLASLSAVLFGAMTVALRIALRRVPDAEAGTLVMTTSAFAVVAAFAVVQPPDAGVRDIAVFSLAGLLAPGASQLLFTLAVRDAGSSRASVVVGTAPLVAVAIALVFLDEPFRVPLAVGAVLVVVGGIALLGERIRPEGFRAVGLAAALGCTLLFATRDNVVRWAADDTPVSSGAAAAAAMLTAVVLMALYLVAIRGRRVLELAPARLVAFVPAGVFFGLSYLSLFEAYYRGRVSVVSPIVATESLFAVLLSAVLLRHSELVGKRLVVGAALIVAGGVLIGASR
jgi:drug/metabolite transporter (DMT)-like permease